MERRAGWAQSQIPGSNPSCTTCSAWPWAGSSASPSFPLGMLMGRSIFPIKLWRWSWRPREKCFHGGCHMVETSKNVHSHYDGNAMSCFIGWDKERRFSIQNGRFVVFPAPYPISRVLEDVFVAVDASFCNPLISRGCSFWLISSSKKEIYQSSTVAQQKHTRRGSMRMQVWSLAPLSGLRIWCCRELWCRSKTRLRSGVAVAVV